jgi:hypothetical protein
MRGALAGASIILAMVGACFASIPPLGALFGFLAMLAALPAFRDHVILARIGFVLGFVAVLLALAAQILGPPNLVAPF